MGWVIHCTRKAQQLPFILNDDRSLADRRDSYWLELINKKEDTRYIDTTHNWHHKHKDIHCSTSCSSDDNGWYLTHLPLYRYMRQRTGSSFVQVMACRLFGARPLTELMLAYCQLYFWDHISVTFKSDFYHFRSRKCNLKCRLPKWRPFRPGGDQLINLRKKPQPTWCMMKFERFFAITICTDKNDV